MDKEVFWVFTLALAPGKFAEFRDLVAEIVARPGTLAYQYADSDDLQTVHIYERYRDSAAFVVHVEQNFAERFLSLVSFRSLDVYGTRTAQARQALDSFNATYMNLFDDSTRS